MRPLRHTSSGSAGHRWRQRPATYAAEAFPMLARAAGIGKDWLNRRYSPFGSRYSLLSSHARGLWPPRAVRLSRPSPSKNHTCARADCGSGRTVNSCHEPARAWAKGRPCPTWRRGSRECARRSTGPQPCAAARGDRLSSLCKFPLAQAGQQREPSCVPGCDWALSRMRNPVRGGNAAHRFFSRSAAMGKTSTLGHGHVPFRASPKALRC